MAERCAPRNTSKAFATGDLTLTIASGAPVHVYGIWLSNDSGTDPAAFTINDGAGTEINVIEVADKTALELSVPWIADKGIAITGIASTTVTVFHNSPGR